MCGKDLGRVKESLGMGQEDSREEVRKEGETAETGLESRRKGWLSAKTEMESGGDKNITDTGP